MFLNNLYKGIMMKKIQNKIVLLLTSVVLLFTIGTGILYIQSVSAQTNINSTTTRGGSQNQTGEFDKLITGPNQPSAANDTLPLGTSISQEEKKFDKISLIDAITLAQENVGPNSHAEKARLGIWNDGTMVYLVLVIDKNNNMHQVIVNAQNGTVMENNKINGANSFFMLLL
jgi:uncharacterized membrane protein YkoI